MSIQTIPLLNLSFAFIPAIITVVILFSWSLKASNALFAIARMLVQLLMVGYVLTYIFDISNSIYILLLLMGMVFISSWIALGTVGKQRWQLYRFAVISMVIGGGVTLLFITQVVLSLEPWYLPQAMIPIAGMIFSSSMNSISLAAERLQAEIQRGVSYTQARGIAFQASLIPITNSLFAVGLVSLPGMMTGQILSGVSPLIAVRYQIMVMCMIFGAAGIASACFIYWVKPVFLNYSATKS